MNIRKKSFLIIFFCLSVLMINGQILYGMDIEGKLHHIANLTPGGGGIIEIFVKNNSDRPEDIQVYQTDYLFYANGNNVFGKPGSVARSNAPWIKVSPNQFSLAPGERKTVTLQIKVPSQDSLNGTYWSLVHVDEAPSKSLEPPEEETENEQLNMNIKAMKGYGIQIITHIGPISASSLQIKDPDLILDDRDYIFSLNMECDGDFMANPTTWIELFDSKGSQVERVVVGNYFIYPGCSMKVNYPLGTLEKGEYKALVIADCGNEQVYGAQYELLVK